VGGHHNLSQEAGREILLWPPAIYAGAQGRMIAMPGLGIA
jgi:hypothetical protein